MSEEIDSRRVASVDTPTPREWRHVKIVQIRPGKFDVCHFYTGYVVLAGELAALGVAELETRGLPLALALENGGKLEPLLAKLKRGAK